MDIFHKPEKQIHLHLFFFALIQLNAHQLFAIQNEVHRPLYHHHHINYWLNELPKFVDKFNGCKIASFQKDFKPIFIFGVPRSGTTLVESIISASNKSIKIGEETSIIHFFTKQLIVKNNNINNLENFVTKIIG